MTLFRLRLDKLKITLSVLPFRSVVIFAVHGPVGERVLVQIRDDLLHHLPEKRLRAQDVEHGRDGLRLAVDALVAREVAGQRSEDGHEDIPIVIEQPPDDLAELLLTLGDFDLGLADPGVVEVGEGGLLGLLEVLQGTGEGHESALEPGDLPPDGLGVVDGAEGGEGDPPAAPETVHVDLPPVALLLGVEEEVGEVPDGLGQEVEGGEGLAAEDLALGQRGHDHVVAEVERAAGDLAAVLGDDLAGMHVVVTVEGLTKPG